MSKAQKHDKLYQSHTQSEDYLIAMAHSPLVKVGLKPGAGGSDLTPNAFQLMIAAFFTAVIIMITYMHDYQRPMGQFYWSGGMTSVVDFFSYYKMTAIMICGILALLVFLYHTLCQTLVIRKSIYYIPMIVYCLFVLASYALSDYKEFALFGYNDRFEGTVSIIGYMIMLFYIINLVTSEKAVKWVLYPLAITSALLGLLGLSQALDVDFFRTFIGRRLITPPNYWPNVDGLQFTFQNREIYQTVYNINYVSFYLTLLVPLFAMIFIHEQHMKKKVIWGALFTLLFFNMIGAQSSGGIMGLAMISIMALIVFHKRLWQWRKSVAVLLILMLAVSAGTFARFAPELFSAVNSVLGKQVLSIPGQEAPVQEPEDPSSDPVPVRSYIDYIETDANQIRLSLNGEELTVQVENMADPQNSGLSLYDKDGEPVEFLYLADQSIYAIADPRFHTCKIQPAKGENDTNYIVLFIDEMQWPFLVTPEKMLYVNAFGKTMDLTKVAHVGFEDNQEFGSGRGYIWSRSIPMLKDALILGHGADTYCLYFPHHDYAGKYNSGTFSGNINIIVDKPHNMYMGMIIGTGGISVLAFLALALIYIVQSVKLYIRLDFKDGFLPAAGSGIFLGICGFLVSALVNDSSVSVMPMFYGLLGVGIAINTMIKKRAAHV